MCRFPFFLRKIGRCQPQKLVRVIEFPAFPRSFLRASPCRPVEPGAVRRVAWRRARQGGLVPRGLLCAAAMVLSTFGCESPTEVGAPSLLTDGTSFRVKRAGIGGRDGYGVQIPYSFTNRTGSSVFLENCRGGFTISLEMQKAGEWVWAWNPLLLLCLSPPIVIEPDEVYRTTLDVVGIPPPDVSTAYRIAWGTGLSSYDPDRYPFGPVRGTDSVGGAGLQFLHVEVAQPMTDTNTADFQRFLDFGVQLAG